MFLAPEWYKKNEVSEKNDVWSIGVILYLLITGGVNDKKHEEQFDFKEHAWLSCSEEMMEFMLGCVAMESKKRMTVTQLLNHPFIRFYHEGKLSTDVMDSTNLLLQANMYKFQTANVVNQIMLRKK